MDLPPCAQELTEYVARKQLVPEDYQSALLSDQGLLLKEVVSWHCGSMIWEGAMTGTVARWNCLPLALSQSC